MNRILQIFILSFFFSMVMGHISAQNLQVNGVLVTSDNANDVFQDGTVKFDYANNILELNKLSMIGTTHPLIDVVSGNSDLIIDKSRNLTIKCVGTNMYEGSTLGNVGIQYDGCLVINGSGVLKLTTDSFAIKCGHLKVVDGVSVELCRNLEGNGITLSTDSITVYNSVLYVHEGKNGNGVNSSAQYFAYQDCYSNAKLLHKSVERRIRERYRYSYNANTHVYEYRTRTVSKWTRYDGWYDGDEKVNYLIVYPKTYSIWVEGTQVNMYNYNNILDDNNYVYTPTTKTLKVKDSGDVKYEGFLIVENQQGEKEEHYLEEGSTEEVSVEATKTGYKSRIIDLNAVDLLFWTMENGNFEWWEMTESGIFTFPYIVNGTITYDKSTFTLTLENVETSCESGFYAKNHSLNVNLIGTNNFYSERNRDMNIEVSNAEKLTFMGSGTLNSSFINTNCDSVMITDGCTVNTNFINGWGVLAIDSSTLEINGDTMFYNYSGIDHFYDLEMKNVGFSSDSISFSLEQGRMIDPEGFIYKSLFSISPKYNLSTTPLVESDVMGDPNAPKYDLWGRKVTDSYEGIYIQSGKKFYNKK